MAFSLEFSLHCEAKGRPINQSYISDLVRNKTISGQHLNDCAYENVRNETNSN